MKQTTRIAQSNIYRISKQDGTNGDWIIVKYYGRLTSGNPSLGQWVVFDETSGQILDNAPNINDLIEKWTD